MRPASTRLLGAILFVSLAPSLRAERLPEQSDRIVDYQINVGLDPETKQLEGREHLEWRNPSRDTISELWFHLYLNAFKNTRSTFFEESGGQNREFRFVSGRWGWIDVTALKVAGGTDLTSAMRFEHPDDDNQEDQTVMRVTLPQLVPPGGRVELDITFRAQLPEVYARTGYKRDFYFAGQWFPKIGVYEPAGTRGRTSGGWNCHQFHANSEFYADYGRYRVDITVPSRFVVGATGRRMARRDNANRTTTTYTYEQSDVHDFAWTADPSYVEVKRTFSATTDVTAAEYERTATPLGRSLDEVRLSDVEITLLMQPWHMPQLERYVQSVKAAIKHFGLWYGRYPYPTLTVVDPAPGAGGAGGMEYPTLITAGTSFLFNHWPFDRIRAPEQVAIHEFGHQFWYGLVGNNEFEEAWLDEGFNSYSTGRVVDLEYGRDTSVADVLGFRLGEIELARLQNDPDVKFDKVRQPAWKYSSVGAYGFYSYSKPEMLLAMLERYLGERTMARIMRTYHERWRFHHPSSDDFVAVANEVSGQDLRWYFQQTVESGAVLDYEVASVSSVRVAQPQGVFDSQDKRTVVDPQEAARLAEAAQKSGKSMYASTVVVRRQGEMVMPVDVAVKFVGKAVERFHWDGRDPWRKYAFTRLERLEWAEVDPDRIHILDVNWLNNVRRVDGDRRVATKWTARWLFWLQNLAALVGL